MLSAIYKPNYSYYKCGAQLSQIRSETSPGQTELFDFTHNGLTEENRRLMKTVDLINQRFPKGFAITNSGTLL
jgi:DNA polymerase V